MYLLFCLAYIIIALIGFKAKEQIVVFILQNTTGRYCTYSPAYYTHHKFDSILLAVNAYFIKKGKLPDKLDQLCEDGLIAKDKLFWIDTGANLKISAILRLNFRKYRISQFLYKPYKINELIDGSKIILADPFPVDGKRYVVLAHIENSELHFKDSKLDESNFESRVIGSCNKPTLNNWEMSNNEQ